MTKKLRLLQYFNVYFLFRLTNIIGLIHFKDFGNQIPANNNNR